MGFLVLAMLLWAATFGHFSSYVRLEKAASLRQDQYTGAAEALAWGLSLLETGTPGDSPYSCLVTPQSAQTFVLTFTEIDPVQFTVSTRPATPDDLANLPQAPPHF